MYMKYDDNKPKASRYILYARKSTESEDRQVASIESQVDVMKKVAKDYSLNVVEVMSEAGSGFKTGRKVFNSMLEKIERGDADGIVVWKLSRLSRNPDDAGRIMGMLQREQIKHIRTTDRNWLPTDNVLMMYVEFGLTNQFSRDLRADTKRGLEQKAERGWYPGASLPLGYRHAQYKKLGQDEILPNEKFGLVQKGLRWVASNECTPTEAQDRLIALGLIGKKGEALPTSTWYEILVNPLYAGQFEYPAGSGTMYPSKAEKAIEWDEHEAILVRLGLKLKTRPKTHFMPYTGLMYCGECGCSITASKHKKVQKNGNVHHYTHYHCTKRKAKCSQSVVQIVDLEEQYKDLLASIEIPESFHQWAIEEIKKDQERYIAERGQSTEVARRNYDEVVKKLDNLIEKYIEGKVPEEYYNRKLSEYETEKKTCKGLIDAIDNRIDERIKELDEDLGFASTAYARFRKGDEYERREIMLQLGSNLSLFDGVLGVTLRKPLKQVQNLVKEVKVVAKMFEPLEKADNSAKFAEYLSSNPMMGG